MKITLLLFAATFVFSCGTTDEDEAVTSSESIPEMIEPGIYELTSMYAIDAEDSSRYDVNLLSGEYTAEIRNISNTGYYGISHRGRQSFTLGGQLGVLGCSGGTMSYNVEVEVSTGQVIRSDSYRDGCATNSEAAGDDSIDMIGNFFFKKLSNTQFRQEVEAQLSTDFETFTVTYYYVYTLK